MQPISSWPLCTLVFTQLTNLYMILTRHASIVFVVCNLLDRKRQLAKKSKSNIAKLAGEACPLLVPALSSLHRDPKRAKQLRHTHGTTVRAARLAPVLLLYQLLSRIHSCSQRESLLGLQFRALRRPAFSRSSFPALRHHLWRTLLLAPASVLPSDPKRLPL